MNNIISLAALIISLAALVLSFKKDISERQIRLSQLRSDLMLRTIQLVLDYRQYAVALRNININNLDSISKELIIVHIKETIDSYTDLSKRVQDIYDQISGAKDLKEKQITELATEVEELSLRVKSEAEIYKSVGLLN